MRVVHIITGLGTGGAERALYNLLQGGLSEEFDSHVISLGDEGTMGVRIEALGVPVSTLGMRSGKPSIASILKLRRLVKTLQPGLIQGWMYHGNLAASLARFFCAGKTSVLWNVRHSLYHIEKEKMLTRQVIRVNRFLSKSVDSLLYNSRLSREQHERFGFAGSHGKVIPNGINCQQFTFSVDARRRIRSELSIPEEALVLGHVARFHPIKDHANFLQAAVLVLEKYPDTHFILSGSGVELHNAEIQRYIPRLQQGQFHLLGERSDIAEVMSAMDILSNSSWGEAFPNVLGEAMAIGIPCVATDVGDSSFIVGDCGVVVPSKDKVALSEGLESLLAMSRLERCALGERARERVKKEFTLVAIVQQYAELYKTIIPYRSESKECVG